MKTRGAAAPAESARPSRTRSATRDLDVDTLNTSVGYMLRRAQLAVSAGFVESVPELGLRSGQFAVLTVVERNRGITQSEVCDALGIQRTNFVAVIDDLERRGLARRTSAAHDRRSNALVLTAAGRRLLAQAQAMQREHESRIARHLGPGGRAQLLGLLARIVQI